MRTLLTVVFVIALLASLGCAFADQVTFTNTIPLSTTNWSNSISVPQFNPALGTLNRITFVLTGHVEGAVMFESMETIPANIKADLSARLTLMRPDSSQIVVTLPAASITESVGTFDDAIDFGGVSGRKYENLSANRAETMVSLSAADFALFSGTGNVVLPVSAVGASAGSGAGNLLMQFNTLASAEASVIYDYVPVPEPSGVLALLTGIGGLASWTLRYRKH